MSRGKLSFLEKILFLELISGLMVTLKVFFEKKVTILYPHESVKVAERSRGVHYMREKEPGKTACIACLACSKVCPSDCINIERDKAPDGKGFAPTLYTIEMSKCIYCGFCQDSCPVGAINLGHSFHTASDCRSEVLDLNKLTETFHQYEKERVAGEYGVNYGEIPKASKGRSYVTIRGVING